LCGQGLLGSSWSANNYVGERGPSRRFNAPTNSVNYLAHHSHNEGQ
jgi:hypothetical protein